FFSDPAKRRVAQNAKFDWHVLHRFGIPVHDVALDTMLAASLVDPDQPKNIDYLARTRLGVEKIPTQSLIGSGRGQTMADVPIDRLKLPRGRRTKYGYSTDVEVLESLAPHHALPKLLLQHRQYQKLKSTYVDALPRFVHRETGRVHATFHQTVASTGRLSASE